MPTSSVFLFPFLPTLRVAYLFLLTLGSSVLNAPRLALSKQGNRGPLSLSIFVCVLLDPRPADKTTTRANAPSFVLLLARLVRFPFLSPSAHLYQVDWTTSEATDRLRDRASDPFCNVAVSTTLLLRPTRLLVETEILSQEGESVSGTAAVWKGNVAKVNARERYISVKALKVFGSLLGAPTKLEILRVCLKLYTRRGDDSVIFVA